MPGCVLRPTVADECFDALEVTQGAVAGEADVACVIASVWWGWAWPSAWEVLTTGKPHPDDPSQVRRGTDVHIYGTQEPGHRPIQRSIIRS